MALTIDDFKEKTVEETIRELKTDPHKGFSSEEVKKRLKEFGFNEIPEKEEPLWHRIFRRFWGPIPWMIEIAAVLSALVKKWEDFTIILILLFVNAFVDFWQEHKALSALKVLKEKLARKALVLRDGKWQEVDAREIVPGDIVKLKIGDIVPADMKLIGGGDYLLVDQSALTGESLPVTKKPGDVVYGNSIVKKGEMIGVVVATGLNTYFGRTVSLVAKAEREQRSHFQEMVIKVGNFLIIVAVIIVTILVIIELMRGTNKIELLRYALVLTVASIPVALPAVLTVTMAIGALDLARRQVIVSRLAAIEELAGVDVLCSDKTGTLTKNQMTVSTPYTVRDYKPEDLMFYAALASKEENRDPIEIPIFDWLKEKGIYEKVKECTQEKFIPFDPVRKRTEALVNCRGEKLYVTKGAPQVILSLSNPHEFDVKEAYKKVEEFAENGFRTLGVAVKKPDEKLFHFVGLIPLFDPPREDSKAAIEEAKKFGVEVKMVTGDNIAIAKYIARILGIGENIISARELREATNEEYAELAGIIAKAIMRVEGLSEEEAEKKAKEVVKLVEKELEHTKLKVGTVKRHESEIIKIIEEANGFAEVFPEDKYFIVDKLQKAGHIVGMTGDGVNDAPALRKADCGIAVSNATDAARAAADLVLLKPGLMVIIKAFEIARQIFGRMEAYTIYRIAETIRIIGFIALSIIFFHFYPITAIMIILLALLNDIPILAIAYDRVRISPKPVRWDMYEINVMATYLGLAGVVESFVAVFLLFKYFHLPIDLIQTVVFLKLAIKGHGTLYNTRIMDHLWKKPWPAPILWAATYWTRIIGTIIGVYGFGLMTPAGWGWALFMWGYAMVWLFINDSVKLWVWRMYKEKKFMFAPGHFKFLKKVFSA
ncbi:H+-transporting ATPase [Balnearium lithotrophicum]|uniref:H+-transporting ATPase n=1 Tax=Balnearium lithotrophicum TaxID=223788 RepID=A0A521AZB2_9BACT|nr:plasma-membrane proton-efflux P-type ATPase [Balnearium lithotrophicum]SMO39850.1 H+-transporting ATPase [Balnearium lithotrophicum]